MKRRLKWACPMAVLLLASGLLVASARADEWEDAVSAREKMQSSLREAESKLDRQLPESGAARAALDGALAAQRSLNAALAKAKDQASAASSAQFKEKMLRRDLEDAQKEAKRLADARDARYAELMARAQAEQRNKQAELDRRVDELNAWNKRVEAQWAEWKAFRDQINPLMRTYQIPDEQAAYDYAKGLETQRNNMRAACEAEDARHQTAVDAWHADNKAIQDGWTARLAEIERFAAEEGKRANEAVLLASKKQREYVEASGKFAKLRANFEAALADYDQGYPQVAGTLQALGTAQSVASAASGAPSAVPEPYVTRDSAAAAQAEAPPIAVHAPLAAHVFVLPSVGVPGLSPAAVESRQQAAALAAEALAGQFSAPAQVAAAAPAAVPSAAKTVDRSVPPASAGTAPALPMFVGPAPMGGAGGGDDGTAVVVLDDAALTRVFHPGVLVSDAEYQRAKEVAARCAPLIPKLEAQIERLRVQRGGLSADEAEFAQMRREIAVGAVREVIGVYATRLDMLLKNEKMMATFTAVQIQRLQTTKRALDTAKLGLALPHADAAASGREADALRMEAFEEGAAALADLAGSQVKNEYVNKFFEQGGNLLKAGGKLNRHVRDPERPEHPFPQDLKASIEAVGTFCPPIALGIGLEAVGECGLQWAVTQDAVSSLSAGLNSTDEAIIYLSDKLERTRRLEEDAQRLIGNHDAAQRAMKGGGR